MRRKDWGGKRESNPQPPEPQSGALPVELFPPQELHYSKLSRAKKVNYRGMTTPPGNRCERRCFPEARRAGHPPLHDLDASDAYVFESDCAQAGRVEQILGVYDERFLQKVLDAIEVQSAELGPAGADDQGIGSFRHGVR